MALSSSNQASTKSSPAGGPAAESAGDGTLCHQERVRAADSSRNLSVWQNGWAACRLLFFASRRADIDAKGGFPLDPIGWIVPIGLVIGLMWAGSFRVAWWLYGEISNVRVVPSLAVVLLECLFTGSLLILGLARTVHSVGETHLAGPSDDESRPLSPAGSAMLFLTILSQFVLILSIHDMPPWWPGPDDWRFHFNFMYPRPIFRPLLLAPIWGRWGILLAATIGRASPCADAATTDLIARMSPRRLLKHAVLPFALTAIYCSRAQNVFTGIIAGLLVFAITYAVSAAIARRCGGQDRQSLFAAGQVAQLAFLATYRAFWRLIDG